MENTEPLNIPKGAKRTPEKRSRFFSALPLYASRFTLYASRVTRHAPLRRGYSLMEMLLVVAIIGILFTIGGPVLNQANKNFILSRTRLELQTEARGIMYLLTRNLRQAQSSTVVTGRLDNNQAFYSKISFTTASGKSFVFYQKGTSLMMTEGTLNKEQTKNLKYLAFTFPESNDMGIISVSMTLEKAIYEGRTKALHVASEKVRVMN